MKETSGPPSPEPLPFASLPAALLDRAERQPDRVAMRYKVLGRWKQYTWSDFAQRAGKIGGGLEALGVKPGDRVAIHSENRPAWQLADIGAQGIGATVVGIYPTSPAAEVEYLLSHSGAVVLIAEDEEQLDKVLAVRDRLPDLRHVVVIDPRNIKQLGDNSMLMTLGELEARGEAGADRWPEMVGRVSQSDVALIVYTSGTTGPPKGAMLSHRNLLDAAATTRVTFQVTENDEVLSYLPLCHIAERLISTVNGICSGYIVNFGEGGESFSADLRDVQPTFFLGVPRVWERMLAAIQIRMEDSGWFKRWMYRVWSKRGARLARRRWERGSLGPLARVEYALGWVLLYRPLRDKLGLRRVRQALSGAAPIAPQVLEFFWALGVPVREGYGQTENSAQGTITPADDVRIGKVGKPVPGVELKIADDGEILTRGVGTFVGYFRNEDATAATVDGEGWLHTGDVGELDDDGFLTITDRKKDIIITAGGKNISPSEIENRLKVSPYVREAVVIGDRRKYLTALIGIEADTVSNWATHRHLAFTTYEDLSSKAEVRELVAAWVAEVNKELAQVETIKDFVLLPKELDHEEGELTATQKVKRKAISDEFAQLIDGLYAGAELMTEFLQLFVAGCAVGLRYALVVLGFVVIYRATAVINFAQGSFLVLGAYLSHNAVHTWGLSFYLAIPISMAICALIGVLVELLILRRMVGEAVVSIIMITIGLFIVLQEVPTAIWSPAELVGDPWGADSQKFGDVFVETRNIATLILATLVLLGFFALFRFTKAGLAMRATALDQEAALAQGISARRVVALSWAIAGAVGALAGITAAAGPSPNVTPSLGFIALIAFPAMILGGLDSAGGAVIGGLIIGVTQSLTTGWEAGILDFSWLPSYPDVLGRGFDQVTPYIVMIVILLVRPFGLFGTKEVRRV